MPEAIVTHTPGPWLIVDRRHGTYEIVAGDEGQADIGTLWPQHMAPGQSADNAAVIAAAPDLLAVVKRLRHIVYEKLQLDPVDADYCSICEQADIAIAKAEGRS